MTAPMREGRPARVEGQIVPCGDGVSVFRKRSGIQVRSYGIRNTKRSFVLRRYLALAVKNLRRRPVRTGLTVAGVALAVTVAVSLGGFMLGYSGAIERASTCSASR